MFFKGLYGGKAPSSDEESAAHQALLEADAVMVCTL